MVPWPVFQGAGCWTDSRQSASVIMMEHTTTVRLFKRNEICQLFSEHTSVYVQRIAALHWLEELIAPQCIVFSCTLLTCVCHCTKLIFFRHFRLEFQIICIPLGIDSPNRPTKENKRSIPAVFVDLFSMNCEPILMM